MGLWFCGLCGLCMSNKYETWSDERGGGLCTTQSTRPTLRVLSSVWWSSLIHGCNITSSVQTKFQIYTKMSIKLNVQYPHRAAIVTSATNHFFWGGGESERKWVKACCIPRVPRGSWLTVQGVKRYVVCVKAGYQPKINQYELERTLHSINEKHGFVMAKGTYIGNLK